MPLSYNGQIVLHGRYFISASFHYYCIPVLSHHHLSLISYLDIYVFDR